MPLAIATRMAPPDLIAIGPRPERAVEIAVVGHTGLAMCAGVAIEIRAEVIR
ncbi:MAG: hypothetical protein ACYC7F_00985 [Gemmatimonadaceae bacterium]